MDLLDRFYDQHHDLGPEEIRWRSGGLWRIVPRGIDKEQLANWASEEMELKDCVRLLYVVCLVRKRLGLPVPRTDLRLWLSELLAEELAIPTAILSRVSGLHVSDEVSQEDDETARGERSSGLAGFISSLHRVPSFYAVKRWWSSAIRR
jgi:hypothetical protein